MKTNTLFISSFILTSLSLFGCQQESYTVEYLVENTDIRNEVLEDCKDNKQTKINCENAQEALSKVKYQEYSNSAFK